MIGKIAVELDIFSTSSSLDANVNKEKKVPRSNLLLPACHSNERGRETFVALRLEIA